MAAVIAARFSPWQPNSASSSVPNALLAMIGPAGVANPLARSTAMPRTNWPVSATITNGNAMCHSFWPTGHFALAASAGLI